MSAAAQTGLMSAERLLQLPDDDLQYELDEGLLIRMAPAGGVHGRIETDLFGKLYVAQAERALGQFYIANTGFLLFEDPDTVRCPDIGFVRKENLPRATAKGEGYIIGPPDLAVEIQSPSQSPADLAKKVQQYLDAGAQTVWVLFPKRNVADIHEAGMPTRTIGLADYLESSVLPGVRIQLGEILAG
ncbi:MAG TPA: Uma2 family endonuclease [Bryobacterales bacterium]|nr:Uma2 family endonuclease [Bryobacterales bacterium]